MPFFQSSVGTKHSKYAVPTELKYYVMPFSNGLKPVATKLTEPTALEKDMYKQTVALQRTTSVKIPYALVKTGSTAFFFPPPKSITIGAATKMDE